MMNIYECLNNIDITELDGEWIVMDTEKFTVTKVNEVGARILEGLIQKRNLESIVQAIVEEFGVDQQIVCADANVFLTELKGLGIISNGTTQPASH
jgi:hypothetical protein